MHARLTGRALRTGGRVVGWWVGDARRGETTRDSPLTVSPSDHGSLLRSEADPSGQGGVCPLPGLSHRCAALSPSPYEMRVGLWAVFMVRTAIHLRAGMHGPHTCGTAAAGTTRTAAPARPGTAPTCSQACMHGSGMSSICTYQAASGEHGQQGEQIIRHVQGGTDLK